MFCAVSGQKCATNVNKLSKQILIAMGPMEVWFFLSALNISGKPYLGKRSIHLNFLARGLISWFSFFYLSQTFFVRRNFSYFIRLQLKVWLLSLALRFSPSYFSDLKENKWRILRGRLQTVWRDFPIILAYQKRFSWKAHYSILQFFGQPKCENRIAVKRDSSLLGVLNMAGRSLGKLYPTNLKVTN